MKWYNVTCVLQRVFYHVGNEFIMKLNSTSFCSMGLISR